MVAEKAAPSKMNEKTIFLNERSIMSYHAPGGGVKCNRGKIRGKGEEKDGGAFRRFRSEVEAGTELPMGKGAAPVETGVVPGAGRPPTETRPANRPRRGRSPT